MIEANVQKDEEPTIGMLLDTEHVYGGHSGRLGPAIMTVGFSLLPALLYAYFGLFNIIPIWMFLPANTLFAIWIIRLIPGRENYRLADYRKRLYDDYTDVSEMMRIRKIHPHGLVEYVSGECFYAVKGYNGTCENELARTQLLRKFMSSMIGDFDCDIYILNESYTGPVRRYYNNLTKFGKNAASMNFTKIIDMVASKTKNKSMVQCTVFILKGRRSDWKQMKSQIDGALGSSMSSAFKRCYRVHSRIELTDLINHDIDTNVDIDELLRAKYKTGEYYTSRVVAYDPKGEVVIGDKADSEATPKASVQQPSPKKSTFHVRYEEDASTDTEVRAVSKPDYYVPVTLEGVAHGEEENNSLPERRSEEKRGRQR